MSHSAPGSRSQQRRRVEVNATTVLAVLLPLLTLAALVLVRPEAPATVGARPPTLTSLSTASVVCPSALDAASPVLLSTAAAKAAGRVTLDDGADTSSAKLAEGEVTSTDAVDGPVAVTGEDALAPGLLGARFGGARLAASSCPPPAPDQWFTAVGAGARHSSTLELVNPDTGPAIADITVYRRVGILDVPRLRGVSVPGRSSVRLDLGAVSPRRGELAIHVVTSRGRLSATVLDTYDELGAGSSSQDWLAAQVEPSTVNELLGVPTGRDAQRMLVVANPGDSEVRATLKVITAKSTFAPEGVDELRIRPGAVERLPVTGPLADALAKDALGLQVTTTAPVTATLRSFVGGDLALAVAPAPVEDETRVIVPEGDKQVLVSGATSTGAVTVVARSASGEELARTRAEVRPGQGVAVDVPAKAVLVELVPERTPVVAAVLVRGNGATVVPFRPLVLNGLVPEVGPGLP
ncbi:hypothetical protein H5V45_16880 [Nocardioides sp. KIGAM211]|uniref:Secreted protein n=1 Tax=Nocardioides luti TaxID=2761101 RepID=A0A7X0RL44_9ACTN|nr:DUF5719 family protein [Nocardioides luti]MBB6629003.1 hypothetical protein [Nocardioides luti]